MVLVQAEGEADWSRLGVSDQAYFLPGRPPAQKPITLAVSPGQILRFRLRVNPVGNKAAKAGVDGKRPRGKRIGVVGEEKQQAWLAARFEKSGAKLLECVIVNEGVQEFGKSRENADRIVLHSILVDGYIQVTDPVELLNAVQTGIGAAKGFGFGLLSVAAVRG